MLIGTEALDVANLTALLAAAAPLHTVSLGLFTNNFAPNRQTPLSQYVEPTYSGYARQLLVWGAIGRDPAGNIVSTANILTFQMANANTPTTVWGYFLVATESTGSGGSEALGGELFTTPQQLIDSLSQLNLAFAYTQTNGAQGYATIVE